ncbi:hypothetical protein NC653_033097 [Populus alba x Populus x berolinensis]|uniref:Peptidylprolyl isomerase n=1 Tax=Populus alba x Populus x berolinensis TaxID=444605 RepID=A0AAD6LSU7_9ROSI|nr:hypothetical protein NC653_033097 [Populus alba x Populus x berolinensis]
MGDLTGVLVGNDLQVAKTLKPSFAVKHVGPAVLSMANSGPNTNGSHLYSKVAAVPSKSLGSGSPPAITASLSNASMLFSVSRGGLRVS